MAFGAQNCCWPWSTDDPPRYAVPESSVPSRIYGPGTDTDVNDESNSEFKYLQRLVHSAVVMARVGAMRTLFDRALAQAPQDANFGSGQYILGHMFGHQELYREILRRNAGLKPKEGLDQLHIEGKGESGSSPGRQLRVWH